MQLITPQIALGSRMDAADPVLLEQFSIDAVLSMEPVRLIQPVSCQMILQVKDRVPLPDMTIQHAVEFMHQQVTAGKRVLIHCQMGISRSPALLMAYLHQHQNLSLLQALQQIQRLRPQAEPHPVLIQSLQAYYREPPQLQESLDLIGASSEGLCYG
ncbi:MAG: dual specificity protein phosphatase [Motiliproteus sp.]